MNRYCRAVAALAAVLTLVSAQSVFGHGFVLSLDSNKIDGDGRENGSGVPDSLKRLFTHSLASQFNTDHGSVQAKSSGVFIAPFDAQDTFRIDFVGPLWYSDGGAAIPSTTAVLEAVSDIALGSPVNIDGTSASPSGFPVSGASSHSIEWFLSGSSVPAGAYGVAYQVSGWDNGNSQLPFITSEPFVVVFHTSGFTGSANGTLQDAQLKIFQQAVPEPGTIALSLAGFGSLILAGWWRKRRQA